MRRKSKLPLKALLSYGVLLTLSPRRTKASYNKALLDVIAVPDDFNEDANQLVKSPLLETKTSVHTETSTNDSTQTEPTDIQADDSKSDGKSTAKDSDDDTDGDSNADSDANREIEDFRFFITFLKTVFWGTLKRQQVIRSLDINSPESDKTVSFMELRTLFRLGPDELVIWKDNEVIRVGQVISFGGQEIHDHQIFKSKAVEDISPRHDFEVLMFHWFFNGTKFLATNLILGIPAYTGSIPIQDLKVYPIRFLPDSQKPELEYRTKMFFQFAEEQSKKAVVHKFYIGFPLESPPNRYIPKHEGEV